MQTDRQTDRSDKRRQTVRDRETERPRNIAPFDVVRKRHVRQVPVRFSRAAVSTKGGWKPGSEKAHLKGVAKASGSYVMRQDKRQNKQGINRQTLTRQERATYKTRQETRQDKARQDKTRQDKTRQDKTRQDKTRQDKTRQDKTRQDKT